jgi:hypothetical protein
MPVLQDKLDSLRSRIRLFLVFQGLVYLLFALLIAVLLDLGIDRLLRLHVSQRALLTGGLLVVLGVIVTRYLFSPASLPLSDEDVAVLIEHRNPQLGDRLISALQFDRMMASGKVMSPRMVERVKQEASQLATPIVTSAMIDRQRLGQLGLFCCGVLAAATLAGIAIPAETWATWVNRNLVFGTEEWPYRCKVELVGFKDGVARIPYGDPFNLEARALTHRVKDGSLYEQAEALTIRYRFGGGRWQSVTVIGSIDEQLHTMVYRYPLGALLRPVEVTVQALDYRSPIHRVEIAARPELEVAQLEISQPAYTTAADASREQVLSASGRVPVLVGSRITFRGRANKPLTSITVHRGSEVLPVTAQIATGGHDFTFSFDAGDPKDPAGFRVALTDHEHVTSSNAAVFSLLVEPDALPQIRARLKGIGDRITRWASVPIEVEVRDRFGIGEVRLRYVLQRKRKPGEEAQREVEGVLVQARYPQPGEQRFPLAVIRLDLEQEFERRRAMDPTIEPPAEGDRLRLAIQATDYAGTDRVASAPPQEFSFPIVPDTELAAHLLAKQRRIRRQYSALLDRVKAIQWVLLRMRAEAEGQLENAGRVRQLFRSKDLDKDGRITPTEYGNDQDFTARDRDKDGALTISDFGSAWALTEADNVQLDQQGTEQRRVLRAALRLAEGLEDIREEMENNRLDRDGKSREKLEQRVIRPMKELADREMTALAASLEQMARLPAGSQPLGELDADIELAERVLLAMAEILRQMVWSELFDDVVTRLRAIVQLELELKRMTEDEHKRRIETLLPEDERQDDRKPGNE